MSNARILGLILAIIVGVVIFVTPPPTDSTAAAPEKSAAAPAPEQPAAAADDSNPSFLQAGIFFMTGREPPKDVQFLGRQMNSDVAIVFNENEWHEQHWGLRTKKRGRLAKHSYQVDDDEPCTIRGTLVDPPYGLERLEFQKLPSPRAIEFATSRTLASQGLANLTIPLQTETWCRSQGRPDKDNHLEIIPDTTKCIVGRLDIVGAPNLMLRRLHALDYIRARFCHGQPEPPQAPTLPY